MSVPDANPSTGFLGDDNAAGDLDTSLPVNVKFAASLARTAARSLVEKRKAAAARAPLSVPVVAALQRTVTRVLRGLSPTASMNATPAAVTRGIIDSRCLVLCPSAVAALDAAGGGVGADERDVTAALSHADIRIALRQVLKWVKATATARRAEKAAPPPSVKIGAVAPLPSSTKLPCCDINMNVAAVCASRNEGLPADASSPALIPLAKWPHSDGTASQVRYPHGRGAGRGRGLDFRGEPHFVDMHASWQAARRQSRRAAKTTTRALRSHAMEKVVLRQGILAGIHANQTAETAPTGDGTAPSHLRFDADETTRASQ